AFCLFEDEALRHEFLKLIHDLRAAGLVVDYSLTPAKSDKQFKRAQELKAAHTIKIERNQTGELQARMKSLKTRQEAIVPLADAPARLLESKAGAFRISAP
ncbi:MAG: His/Gly/Thr/Pro-type tRNA ligase C-terminal domain-containing protein, partial [Verrucomicrobia bacterium]|nr:His/Gly/Thr/Pro-type tRNA ligase C-terminal domain-containing protein [Verrucomicrobiota bacterium]